MPNALLMKLRVRGSSLGSVVSRASGATNARSEKYDVGVVHHTSSFIRLRCGDQLYNEGEDTGQQVCI